MCVMVGNYSGYRSINIFRPYINYSRCLVQQHHNHITLTESRRIERIRRCCFGRFEYIGPAKGRVRTGPGKSLNLKRKNPGSESP